MKQISIKADIRTGTGTSAINKIKTKGIIPAVLYGKGKGSTSLSLQKMEFENTFRKNRMRAIYSINIEENGKNVVRNTLIKDIQYDPIKTRIIHVDFYEYDEHKKIRTMVPVITTGTPIGCKNGGILTHNKSQIEIDCLPINIPEHFELDVTNLNVHDALRISDIHVGSEIHIHGDPHDVLVTVAMPQAEEVPVAAEGAEGAEAAAGTTPGQPEVIAKGKAAKEGAEAPAKDAKK